MFFSVSILTSCSSDLSVCFESINFGVQKEADLYLEFKGPAKDPSGVRAMISITHYLARKIKAGIMMREKKI